MVLFPSKSDTVGKSCFMIVFCFTIRIRKLRWSDKYTSILRNFRSQFCGFSFEELSQFSRLYNKLLSSKLHLHGASVVLFKSMYTVNLTLGNLKCLFTIWNVFANMSPDVGLKMTINWAHVNPTRAPCFGKTTFGLSNAGRKQHTLSNWLKNSVKRMYNLCN